MSNLQILNAYLRYQNKHIDAVPIRMSHFINKMCYLQTDLICFTFQWTPYYFLEKRPDIGLNIINR